MLLQEIAQGRVKFRRQINLVSAAWINVHRFWARDGFVETPSKPDRDEVVGVAMSNEHRTMNRFDLRETVESIRHQQAHGKKRQAALSDVRVRSEGAVEDQSAAGMARREIDNDTAAQRFAKEHNLVRQQAS